jgi:phage shock protein PspC (stress-responsive transcriptional regulator)
MMEVNTISAPFIALGPLFFFIVVPGLLIILGVILLIKLLNNRPSNPPDTAGTSPSRAERTSLLRQRRDRYQQERTRILGMVDSGQISAGEAAQLLNTVERETTTMACPFCEKDIRIEALKCHHCGSYLVEEDHRPRRLTRSDNKMLAGVCAGIAEYAGMDTSLVRILVALVTFFSGIITGLLIYLVAALVMPPADTAQ